MADSRDMIRASRGKRHDSRETRGPCLGKARKSVRCFGDISGFVAAFGPLKSAASIAKYQTLSARG